MRGRSRWRMCRESRTRSAWSRARSCRRPLSIQIRPSVRSAAHQTAKTRTPLMRIGSFARRSRRGPRIPETLYKAGMFSLDKQGITVSEIHRNATPAFLYEAALKCEKGTAISSTGAMIAYSGKKTGRSPTDKRVVDEPEVRDDIWWGNVNIKLDPQS